MSHVGEVNRRQENWLMAAWKIKAVSLRDASWLYVKAGFALFMARFFPAGEMRKLEKRLGHRHGRGEDIVLRYTGKWFGLLERVGLRSSCRVRSLALARVLRREGYDAHIVFGVRSDNGEMEGHCWVSIGGRAVTEAPESFKELHNE